MSETVKLIIEIPKEDIEFIRKTSFVEDERTMFKQSPSDRQGTMMLFRLMDSAKNGIPLANDSEKAEVQAYFEGEAYGWEEGRKALVDDVKAEIEEKISHYDHFQGSNTAHGLEIALEIIDKHISGEGDKE